MENLNLAEWVSIAVGLYELASRVVKTTKSWSIIGNVLKVLHEISQKLDRNDTR